MKQEISANPQVTSPTAATGAPAPPWAEVSTTRKDQVAEGGDVPPLTLTFFSTAQFLKGRVQSVSGVKSGGKEGEADIHP